MFDTLRNYWNNRNNPERIISPYTKSYSQYGEDQIILALLFIFKLEKVNYLDIGANDPFVFNNTAALYENGITGINIEPDPVNFANLSAARVNDTNLNIGISNTTDVLKYYRFTDSVYNTFSPHEFENLSKKTELIRLPDLDITVQTYNDIVKEFLNGKAPTILFIDTEGLDELIINSIDFDHYAPSVICIETFSYGQFKKDHDLIEAIQKKGYSIHADTFVNTIFIHNSLLPYPIS